MRYRPRRSTRGPCSRVDIRRPMRQDVHVKERDVKRLADAVTDRRGELGLTQEEFADQCGVSLPTIQRIEARRITPRATTLAGLDRGARWKQGSARATLAGGRPTPIGGPRPLADLTRQEAMDRAAEVARAEGDEAGTDFMLKWAHEVIKAREAEDRDQSVTPGDPEISRS